MDEEVVLQDIDAEALREYVSDMLECTKIKLVDREGKELAEFAPEYMHQVFNEEQVFGYKDLKLCFTYTAGSLDLYVSVDYAEKIDQKPFEAEDILKLLRSSLLPEETSFVTSSGEFEAKCMEKQKDFKPHGTLLHKYDREDKAIEGQMNHCEIYTVRPAESAAFRSYLAQMETFALYFIETAAYIDGEDERWNFYVSYRVVNDEEYELIGYTSTYDFYGYPDGKRVRVAQVVILPPFKGRGHGRELLKCIYTAGESDATVVDVQVEDPSPAYQSLRDALDLERVLKAKLVDSGVKDLRVPKEFYERARKQLKLGRKQAKKVYQMAILKNTNMLDENQAREYRLGFKRSLWNAVGDDRNANPEELKQSLEAIYQDTLKHYQDCIDRVDARS
eukprot:Clim_evm69s150 gene=Clim_evmTU69s150